MATNLKKVTSVTHNGDFTVATYFWEAMVNGDDGAPIHLPENADVSFQVAGTFGVGGSVSLEGSMKPTAPGADADYFVLTDPQGNAITKTAAAGEAVTEGANWIRPHITAGDGTTDLDVYVLVRRPTDKRA